MSDSKTIQPPDYLVVFPYFDGMGNPFFVKVNIGSFECRGDPGSVLTWAGDVVALVDHRFKILSRGELEKRIVYISSHRFGYMDASRIQDKSLLWSPPQNRLFFTVPRKYPETVSQYDPVRAKITRSEERRVGKESRCLR